MSVDWTAVGALAATATVAAVCVQIWIFRSTSKQASKNVLLKKFNRFIHLARSPKSNNLRTGDAQVRELWVDVQCSVNKDNTTEELRRMFNDADIMIDEITSDRTRQLLASAGKLQNAQERVWVQLELIKQKLS